MTYVRIALFVASTNVIGASLGIGAFHQATSARLTTIRQISSLTSSTASHQLSDLPTVSHHIQQCRLFCMILRDFQLKITQNHAEQSTLLNVMAHRW